MSGVKQFLRNQRKILKENRLQKGQMLLKKTVPGVYTVEASWIISFCLLLTGVCLTVSLHMYTETLSYIENTLPKELDAVKRFHLYSIGAEVLE